MATSIVKQVNESNYLESYILIWLDEELTIDNNKQEILKKLRSTINYQKTFNDIDHCREFINTIKNERLVIISNERLSKQLNLSPGERQKISAVYIYCADKVPREQESQLNENGNNIMISMDELVTKIELDQRKRERLENSMSYSFLKEQQFASSSTATPNYSFVMFELLMDVIVFNRKFNDMDEFITLCNAEYRGNKVEEDRIAEFEQKYTPDKVIKWYTRDSFVYRILNTALRVQNIEILLACQFLIRDIDDQLKKLQQDEHRNITKVYRGQMLSMADLERMELNHGEIISFNSFLSTTCDLEQAMGFVVSRPEGGNLIKVLFEIECDQHSSSLPTSKPFADITSLSSFPSENEVLFTVGSQFRMTDIHYDKERHLHIIKLTHISDTEKETSSTKNVPHELSSDPALRNLIDEQMENEEYVTYYKSLFSELSENESKVMIYIIAGNGAKEQENFDLSLKYLRKALDVQCSSDSPNKRLTYLIRSYMRIVYERKGDWERAEQCFQEALWKETFNDRIAHDKTPNERYSLFENYNELLQRLQIYLPFDPFGFSTNQLYGERFGLHFHPNNLAREIFHYQKMLALSAKALGHEHHLHRSLKQRLEKLQAIARNKHTQYPSGNRDLQGLSTKDDRELWQNKKENNQ